MMELEVTSEEELDIDFDSLVQMYNDAESSRVDHANRADKYRDLLKEALEKLDEYSQKRYDKEVSNFEKEVYEWFECYEYKEEEE